MKRYITIAAALLALAGEAQTAVDNVLQSIAANNKGIMAVEQQALADRAEIGAANSPGDLTVDFEYLWGEKCVPGGNKYGFTIMQGFDFPTLYAQRNKIAGAQDVLGERQVQYARQTVLLQARELCIRLVYLNRQIALVTERVAIADTLAAIYNRRLQEGDANRLEVNRVELEQLSQQTRLKLLCSEREAVVTSLVACNGGVALPVAAGEMDSYPLLQLPATEQEAAALWQERDASLQLLRQQQEMSQMQVSVSRQGWIPKFAIGYKQAYEVGDMFYGLAVGVELPLYKTSNEVKAQKARALAQTLQTDDATVQTGIEAVRLYHETTALAQALEAYELVEQQDNRRLLLTALQNGSISLPDYMTSVAQINEVEESRLLIEYEYYSKLSELNRYDL